MGAEWVKVGAEVIDEVRADILRTRQYDAAVEVVREEADRLERLWRRRDADETIAEAARIIDAAEGTQP